MEGFSSNHALTFALPLGLNVALPPDAFKPGVQLAKVARHSSSIPSPQHNKESREAGIEAALM